MDTPDPYLDTIFEKSCKYLLKSFPTESVQDLKDKCYSTIKGNKRSTIEQFISIYYSFVKSEYQNQYKKLNQVLFDSISDVTKPKILWGGCLSYLREMPPESVQLMVTSPPYYNAREYSQWENLDAYLKEMSQIITECFRVLDNHRPFVFNVGDIFDNDFRYTHSSWGRRRLPLGAYFTNIFESAGFQFVDDFIWDKGEPQTQRHKNGDNPFPLYQYPINCYEHIFVFYKHRLDKTLYPCPVCGCLKVNGNAYSGVGVKSWECKNLDCMKRSEGDRGKRFSARTHTMNKLKDRKNMIDREQLKKWRRDIVKIQPVVKINSKRKNIVGHSAPFPAEIPRYAIQMFSGVKETVLDPFAGSFTTVCEALKQGRNGIGIEINRSMYREIVIQKFNGYPTLEIDKVKNARRRSR